jgi:hypothetical protein
VQAWIKPDNIASRLSFERAGFHYHREENIRGHHAIGYVMHRDDFL